MSVHHRSTGSENNTLYQPIARDESPDAADLQLGDDEEALAEDFIAQEHAVAHDGRIGWIHFILGCAVLLPWNGTQWKHIINVYV